MAEKYLLAGLLATLLAGCAPTLVPHTAYLPTIRDRGMVEIRASTGLNGSELQAGYQATDKLILHAALLNYRHRRSGDGKGFRSADLGAGYYYASPNGNWRLGGHAGVAYGSGTSGNSLCFECAGTDTGTEYEVRYTYVYLQPTALFRSANQTWGFGLRMGHAYYHELTALRAEVPGGPILATSYAGHQGAFVQPTFQYSFQVLRWLGFSSSFGVQRFLNSSAEIGTVNPLVGQAGLQFVFGKGAK
ncbi:hypothetical protein [Hymenobacter sp. UYCo722]|uniref:hypothetical protein n=1 Tax=Hymenobacter sp. UYCo722 TaxID=3156335 RepID=UPI0033938F77